MRNAPITQIHSNVGSFSFPAISAQQLFGVSVQAVQGDASAAGTVKLQASNDAQNTLIPSSSVETTWIDIPNTSQTVTAGAAVLIPFTQIAYQWVRVVWTQTTPGSTTITVKLNVQGI